MSGTPTYALERIDLTNFRRFPKLAVTFEPDVTVLVSRNSGGKSSVLDAVARLLSPFIDEFGHAGPKFTRPDVRLNPDPSKRVQDPAVLPMIAACKANFDHAVEWSIAINRIGVRTKPTSVQTRPLRTEAKRLRHAVAGGESATTPVLAYYGTGRLWKEDVTRSEASALERTDGYDRCMTSQSTSKQLEGWMEQESAVDLDAVSEGRPDRSQVLAAVRTVCDEVLRPTGWGQVTYEWRLRTITATHSELGTIPLSQLSDGVRSMLALAADIAFRAYLLNPHYEKDAPSISPGIIVIDEVDLHLHPEWQFEVLPALQRAFPRIQFIVSTHSPQVLASVEGRCIRNLEATDLEELDDSGLLADRRDIATKGRLSYQVMTEVLEVLPRPRNEITERLERYLALVRTTTEEPVEARNLRQQLERELGVNDTALERARIRLRAEPTTH